MTEDTITAQPVITTGRLSLRPLRQSDQGLLTLYAGDERVARNTRSIPHPLPPGAAEAFVSRATSDTRREDVWAMDASHVGLTELLGVIGLTRLSDDRSEIGYWVAPAFWNTGFATEAVQAILQANPQGVKTIFAEVFQSNAISARVLTNAGFDYIGDAEAFSVAQNSTVPTWTYLKKLS
ncbi:GNAT family N-acetyltransferase [Meridianimarinicoccus roseus]|jgi:RimJ/RimL family protein N-acetyltransferase|uniref:GNAT family N-acetyltransferase n=1 Tax=Meridianimarinicoccus roseus TaxID=2072018 RepID=A0A2V2LEZ7_9RHOB|nr:GNAT family N-acetyltransferase [Meridianimarinicoccus roseus]PWR04045.1 GNAT family N-acetyltransferase [Meridianimarinicoccus roseus]